MAKKKSNAGRPTVMTPETLAKLEDAFAYGLTDQEACFVANISKDALYDYCNKHPEFSDRKEALKQSPTIRAKRTVVKAIDGGDKETAKWYLERKNKDEFSTKTNTQLSSDPDNPVNWNVTVNIPDADKN
jgi:hypothetical protein